MFMCVCRVQHCVRGYAIRIWSGRGTGVTWGYPHIYCAGHHSLARCVLCAKMCCRAGCRQMVSLCKHHQLLFKRAFLPLRKLLLLGTAKRAFITLPKPLILRLTFAICCSVVHFDWLMMIFCFSIQTVTLWACIVTEWFFQAVFVMLSTMRLQSKHGPCGWH